MCVCVCVCRVWKGRVFGLYEKYGYKIIWLFVDMAKTSFHIKQTDTVAFLLKVCCTHTSNTAPFTYYSSRAIHTMPFCSQFLVFQNSVRTVSNRWKVGISFVICVVIGYLNFKLIRRGLSQGTHKLFFFFCKSFCTN